MPMAQLDGDFAPKLIIDLHKHLHSMQIIINEITSQLIVQTVIIIIDVFQIVFECLRHFSYCLLRPVPIDSNATLLLIVKV